VYLYSLAVDEVSQGHLLVAGQLVPRSASTHCVEGEVRVEEVNDELTADGAEPCFCRSKHRIGF